MTLSDVYEFYLSAPSFGIRQVWPANETLLWEFTRDDTFGFFRKVLVSELTFIDNISAGRRDFDLIYTMERNGQSCEQIGLIIKKRCDGGAFLQYWTGSFTLADCAFDVDLCNVKTKIQTDDPMACILKNWNIKENALALVSPDPPPSVFCDTAEYFTCPAQTIAGTVGEYLDITNPNDLPWNDCVPLIGEGWRRYKIEGTYNFGTNAWTIVSVYVRDFTSAGAPPDCGGGWVPVSGGFARPPILNTPQYIPNDGGGLLYTFTIPEPQETETSIARSLNALLVTLIGKYCATPIISNFFNINPDGTAPTNSHYDKAALDCQEIVYFSSWDLASINQPASTVLDIKLSELIEGLTTMFNLQFFYKDGAFYFEHISYLNSRLMLDLTLPEFEKYIKGGWRYTYNKARYPLSEIFEWAMPTGLRLEFDGFAITYEGNPCVPEDAKPITRKAPRIITNYGWIFENTDFVNSLDMDAAAQTESTFLVIVSVTGGVINSESGVFDLQFGGAAPRYLNMMFSFANLHRDYWKRGRPLSSGTMNGKFTEFTDPEKVRTMVEIEIPMCCDDFDQIFRPEDLVKTQLGWCELSGASYEEPAQKLRIKPIA